MKYRSVLQLTFFAGGIALMLCRPAFAADVNLVPALTDFRAQLFAYFKDQPQPLLPIFIAIGQKPGDVYRDIYGGYLARQADCFDQLTPDEAKALLPQAFISNQAKAGAGIDATIASVADAALKSNLDIGNHLTIHYDDVTSLTVSDIALKRAFHHDDANCQQVAQAMIQQNDGSLPMVLGIVFLGKQKLELEIHTTGDASVKAGLNEALKSVIEKLKDVGIEADVGGEVSGGVNNAQQISVQGDDKLPIAWLPAFISLQDLQSKVALLQSGTVKNLESDLASGQAREGRDALIKKYPGVLETAGRIYQEMTKGTPIPFDANNPQHRDYIVAVGTLLAAAFEVFHE